MLKRTKYDRKFIISCDWLSMRVKHPENFIEIENPYFHFKREGQSKNFRNIYKIIDNLTGRTIAHYCTNMVGGFMPESNGLLKLENQQLYIHSDLKQYVIDLLNKLQFDFISITRFDIAFDFQKFYMDIDPEYLIRSFVCGKLIRTVGSRNAEEGTQFGVYGRQKKNKNTFQTISFGSRKSNIQTKLYNKTQQLKEAAKPWIEDLHRETFGETDCDVWRLEFSIMSMTAFFVNDFTFREKVNEIMKKNPGLKKQQAQKKASDYFRSIEKGAGTRYHSLDVLNIHIMYGIFQGLFKSQFSFKRYTEKKRVTSMKDVKLWIFDLEYLTMNKVTRNPLIKGSNMVQKSFVKKASKLIDQVTNLENGSCYYCDTKINGDRAEKIFAKKAVEFYEEHRQIDVGWAANAKDFLSNVISIYQLEDWAAYKYKDYIDKDSNFANNLWDVVKLANHEDKLNEAFAEANLSREDWESKINFNGHPDFEYEDVGRRRAIEKQ